MGVHSGNNSTQVLNATYSEVVHWKKNSFVVPLGKAGKAIVCEISSLFTAFASASFMESVALKAATVLPILFLQKPHRTSKVKDIADSNCEKYPTVRNILMSKHPKDQCAHAECILQTDPFKNVHPI